MKQQRRATQKNVWLLYLGRHEAQESAEDLSQTEIIAATE